MPTQESLNRQALRTIEGWRNTARVIWRKACEADGIPPETKFAVFSKGNKYVQFHDRALRQLWEAEDAYRAGGYVGLTIGGERGTN